MGGAPGKLPRVPLPPPVQRLAWTLRPAQFLGACRRAVGPCFVTHPASGATPLVVLGDPEAAAGVFGSARRSFDGAPANGALAELVGAESVLVQSGAEHARSRRALSATLSPDTVAGSRDAIAEEVERAVELWPLGAPVRLLPGIHSLMASVFLRLLMGGRVPDHCASVLGALVADMGARRDAGPWRAAAARNDPWPTLRRQRDAVDALASSAGDEGGGACVATAVARSSPRALPAAPEAWTRSALATLLVTGHETTAVALGWTLERLARHPEALAAAVAAADAGDRRAVRHVVREALRLRPVIPLFPRRVHEATVVAGYRLPAGAWVAPCAYLIHRDARHYPDPHRFVPARFAGGAGTGTWIPFGGGDRGCVGAAFALEMATEVLAQLLRRRAVAPARRAAEPIRWSSIMFVPGRGVEMRLAAR